MRLSRQFQTCLIFLRKSIERKKTQVKINQQNKIKQTLNNKGNIFYAPKNLKVVCFAFWCFFTSKTCLLKNKQA